MQYVLAVSKVPLIFAVEGKVEEGLLKVKAVMVITVATAAIWLSVIGLSIAIIIASPVFIGQDLCYCRISITMTHIFL